MNTRNVMPQSSVNTNRTRDYPRLFARLFAAEMMLGALLFLPAGTLNWGMAWALLGVHLIYLSTLMRILLRLNPSLIGERSRLITEDTKSWDKWLNPFLGIILLVGWIVAGLDHRYGWSPEMHFGLQITGLIGVTLGYILFGWAMVTNQYFSRVVRIQEDRGHQVCQDGPYQYVRHPGYAGFIPAFLCMSLALGSWWSLLPMSGSAMLLVLRTALEDRTLKKELSGYEEYANQVRFRLLPGVW